ncbi:MAG: DUF115 domain-containing protein [Treponema sp.]|nr:DUF115 domain-containing protein [Treponema sp.]
MNKQTFERNMLALSKTDPLLCTRLSSALTGGGVYRFIEARSGELIPALTGPGGGGRPLHSTVDPRREAERLAGTLHGEGCVVFLGLGGGFGAAAALERGDVKKVLAVEYGRDGLAELLSSRDYMPLLRDPRFRIALDPSGDELEAYLLSGYLPALHGGIRVFPLRARTAGESRFEEAAEAVKRAIEAVSRDYSVQAWFGKRWFSNIIRNLPLAEGQNVSVPPVRRALICAAGPSLEEAIPRIKKALGGGERPFLIACDTALPALLSAGVEPDAAVSIDCQHISCRHFFTAPPPGTRLFLDLSSPPPVAARTENRIFFSGGHPLARYISRVWRALPALDTSGANVTYAALSLAENLGARETVLYGADFSYPLGKTYARGTYIYPHFEGLQRRFTPVESLHSAFLFRDSSLEKTAPQDGGPWRYETAALRYYRDRTRRKEAAIRRAPRPPGIFASGPLRRSAGEFLSDYAWAVGALRSFDPPEDPGDAGAAEIITTLLPLAAALRGPDGGLDGRELFEAVRAHALGELARAGAPL